MPFTIPQSIRWRTLPAQAFALLTFVLLPVWYRLPADTPLLGGTDATRFALFVPAALTVLCWMCAGLPGVTRLFAHPARAIWASLLLALALWAYASTAWAYLGTVYPQVASSAALVWITAAGFALAVAAIGLSAHAITAVLTFGLVWNGVLAGQQVAAQASAGGLWAALKEFPIQSDQAGISVVVADGVRWLRPYGLLPHPNLLAGLMVICLLAGVYVWATARQPILFLLIGAGWTLGLWGFLLTFSRGGYGALMVGALVLLALLHKHRLWRARWWGIVAWAVMVCTVFGLIYHPFLLARAGVGSENTELYSVGERAMLNDAALQTIRLSPWKGVGAGNQPWYAARLLHDAGAPIAGNYPHSAPLALWGDLGLVGLLLWAGAVGCALWAAGYSITHGDSLPRAALIAAFAAWLATGITEYAPVTLLHSLLMGWGIVGTALAPPNRPMLES
jgi:hypothetical protein